MLKELFWINFKLITITVEDNDLCYLFYLFYFWCFNATFNNSSAISWRPVLVVEEAEYPEIDTDNGQATGTLYHLRLRVECTLFVIYKAGREFTPYW
jgi:hypothetical protein